MKMSERTGDVLAETRDSTADTGASKALGLDVTAAAARRSLADPLGETQAAPAGPPTSIEIDFTGGSLDQTRERSPTAGPRAAAPPRGPVDPLGRGHAVGRYVVLGTLGAGGMGVVHAAYDPELDRKVALKLLRPELSDAGTRAGEQARARLLREAQALARLAHPNVVAIHDVGAVGDAVWLAMEFVEGETLGAWMTARRPGWRELLEVMRSAGRGLQAAHAAGLVHRDFKPKYAIPRPERP